MSDPVTKLLIDAGGAIGIGLLVGLEREHRAMEEDVAPSRDVHLGVRPFALLGLFGWTSAYLSDLWPWLPPVALLVTAIIAALSFLRTRNLAPGLTTEVAALVTFNLGLLVHHHRSLAISLAVVTTVLLVSKPWFVALIPKLRRVDLMATLQLLIVLAIVLPLMPVEARDPWGVLSPRRIAIFVTLVAGVQYVGYILSRIFGSGRSAAVTGLLGGMVSSTAVTAVMAQQARSSPAMIAPAQEATLLASAVMAARIIVLLLIVAPRVAFAAAPAMSVLGLGLLVAALTLRRNHRSEAAGSVGGVEVQNPMSLLPAIKLGAVLTIVLVLTAVGHEWLGDRGVVGAAAFSGLADVDAIVLALGRSVQSGQVVVRMALIAVIVAVTSNTVVKVVIAWWSGGRRFAVYVAAASMLALAAALTVAAL